MGFRSRKLGPFARRPEDREVLGYVCTWMQDEYKRDLRLYSTLTELRASRPDLFSPKHDTWEKMCEHVTEVNAEGNYHVLILLEIMA